MPLRAFLACAALTSFLYAEGSALPGIAIESRVVDGAQSAVISVTTASPGQPITVIQFDIRYPNDTLDLNLALTEGSVRAGKDIRTYDVGPGLKRALISGINQNPIPDGVIATLSLRAKAGAAPGIYPLAVENQVASTAAGMALYLPGSNGGVIVPGAGIYAPSVTAVANAASYAVGEVAPGEIVIIGGKSLANPAVPADTRVLFDERYAFLIYATAQQVSAVVPDPLEGQRETSIQVESQGIRSAPVAVAVSAAVPGIFTLNQLGAGQGAIVNQDGSVNGPGNPAPRGSIVQIYATGAGATVPLESGPPGLRRPVLAVRVSIGEQAADVLYAGSTVTPGLFQVNARVPALAPAGAATPVVVTVGSRSSQPGVTMAIQ